MKFYQSPLSIFGTLYILAGFYLLYLVFANGMYADVLYLWLFLTGLVMIIVDIFLRRASLPLLVKILIQVLIGAAPLVLFYLFLIGVIMIG